MHVTGYLIQVNEMCLKTRISQYFSLISRSGFSYSIENSPTSVAVCSFKLVRSEDLLLFFIINFNKLNIF